MYSMPTEALQDATLAISNGRIIGSDGMIEGGTLIAAQERILYVGISEGVTIPPHVKTLDASGQYVSPGFIDLHVNGGGGCDITRPTNECVAGIARGHVGCGTTSLLVSITGPSEGVALEGLRVVRDTVGRRTGGARILGAQMEGPFVNPKRQGPVFRECDYVTNPSIDKLQLYIDEGEGCLKIITIAPELENATSVISHIAESNIRASVGHSDATYDQTQDALRAGVTYAVHMFNALSGLSHSSPGAALALLESGSNVALELIADGHHVHPSMVRLLMKVKGLSDVVPVSDATEIVGTDRRSFTLPIGEGFVVEVRDGRTWGPKGELIGSVLKLNDAVSNLVKWCGFDIVDVIRAMTSQPAALLGCYAELGSLEVGKLADIVVLNDNLEVQSTIVGGEVVFSSQ